MLASLSNTPQLLEPPAAAQWAGWSVETFRRPEPGGPDTWLIIFTHAGRVAFGAGLDEATAWGRALAAWCNDRRDHDGALEA